MAVTKKRKRKTTKNLNIGQAHIKASRGNTIITLTDDAGNAVAWSSSGAVGFKGSKQKTPFAAQQAAETAAKAAVDLGLKTVDVYVKGSGNGRESAIRALQTAGLQIRSIADVSGIPHNGCRPPKRRRI